VRYLLPLGYRDSLITEIRRTIERRLIRTLHLGERSILWYGISRLNLARDKQRPTSSRNDIQLVTTRVPRLSPALVSATNGRDRKRFEMMRIAMHHPSEP
jgi:hypothetical protein